MKMIRSLKYQEIYAQEKGKLRPIEYTIFCSYLIGTTN